MTHEKNESKLDGFDPLHVLVENLAARVRLRVTLNLRIRIRVTLSFRVRLRVALNLRFGLSVTLSLPKRG